MFDRIKRARNQDGTFKKDVWWTPWSDSWEYKMSEDLKDMLERTLWTFIEAFLGALVVAPLVSLDANTLELAALAGGGAANDGTAALANISGYVGTISVITASGTSNVVVSNG